MQPRTKVLTAVLLVLLAFVILFFTVPGVAAAIQKWFGYVPGVGLVREGEIRVLAAPTSLTREGVTLTVEQVILETDSITIRYTVEGVPDSAYPRNFSNDWCTKSMTPILRFPGWQLDPQAMTYVEGGNDGQLYKFSAMPPAGDDAVFILPCIYNVRAGGAPEDWEIPLHFVPAPPDMTAYPVIEVATPTVFAETETGQEAATPFPAAITLTVDRVVLMEDSVLLYVALHWEGTEYFSIDLDASQPMLHVLDAAGQEVPSEQFYDDATVNDATLRRTVFAVRAGPVSTGGPLTVVVDSLKVQMSELAEKPSFTFDAGANPQLGQTWPVNQSFQIGAHTLRVDSVELTPGGLLFWIQSDTVLDAAIYDPAHTVCAGGGGGENGWFSTSFTYCDDVALSGPVTIEIGAISVRLDGPWQVQWTPPVP